MSVNVLMVLFVFFIALVNFIAAAYLCYSRSYSNSYVSAALNRRKQRLNILNTVAVVFLDRALWALLIYRVNFCIGNPLIGRVITNICFFLTGIEIYHNAKIGKNVQIWHGQGTVIGQNSTVGEGCLILHQVTLGSGFVVLEDYVKVGAGAKILGTITVGRGSVIGANAVVTKDLPPNSLIKPDMAIFSLRGDASIQFGTKP